MTAQTTPDVAMLRRLGVTVAVLLAIIGWIFLLTDLFGASIFSISAIVILTASLIKPSLLKRGDKILISFAEILRRVIPKFILILLFYLIATPIGLVIRFSNKYRSSTNSPEKNQQNYWLARKPALHEREQLEKQY